MLRREYDTQTCSIAKALEILGERWSLLIVREVALFDVTRFDDLVSRLGITRSVLATRLEFLVAEGVLEREAYQEHPPRYEYRATEKGRQLWPILMHLKHWGDEYYRAPNGSPRTAVHAGCGGQPDGRLQCDRCGKPLDAANTVAATAAAAPREEVSAQ
ncbi:MAG: transcriptional regulator, HxlR family [Amycolatopsis sp.]|jgi:DNA-binding HxlR family transcriptional regulator|uniref:winged helix-turn-helix transcriptional regulator n=1 Tax=Amycolatopsis sp. TaxID=37632 RepID=UPI00260A2FF0|nr:helix-turn-helix domain-containing protein [Amycolatopsis sp.]MCU1683376.1 transcriptional regulator, HxlR family [Amycolatopsis sp.]